MAVALLVAVGLAAFAPLCCTKTDLVLSVYSSIADVTACIVDMVIIPTEGIVLAILLPAGVCELCGFV